MKSVDTESGNKPTEDSSERLGGTRGPSNAGLEHQLGLLRAQIDKKDSELRALRASWSWRITVVFRILGRGFSRARFKRLVYNVMQFLWQSLPISAETKDSLKDRIFGAFFFGPLKQLQIYEDWQQFKSDDVWASHKEPVAASNEASATVVIAVHNALSDVKECIFSLIEHWSPSIDQIVIVDDGSEPHVKRWLAHFTKAVPNFALVDLPANVGYTRAINEGIKHCHTDFCVLLNSDTTVTTGWMDGLLEYLLSDDKLAAVSPLSNAASWQSIPHLFDDSGQFSQNQEVGPELADDIAQLIKAEYRPKPVYLPFLNGFCLAVRSKVLGEVGCFDEVAFPEGYGEENDFCLRVRDAGYELAVATDVFVHHKKSKSFGHERRAKLSKAGAEKLRDKYGQKRLSDLIAQTKSNKGIEGVRQKVRVWLENRDMLSKQALSELTSLRVLFLLPVGGGGGGAHSVVQEAIAMRQLGAKSSVAVPRRKIASFEKEYGVGGSSCPKLFRAFEDEVERVGIEFDVVVATIFNSVKALNKLRTANPHILPAYYVQDYEPFFWENGSSEWLEARESYTLIENCILFAKTEWLVEKVLAEHRVPVSKVKPSIDHAIYNPAKRTASHLIRFAAMVRPKTPRRGAERTLRVLKALKKHYGESVEIKIFGCEEQELAGLAFDNSFEYQNFGICSRADVAKILKETDIFIDLSDYQAFGRTGIEAMACGAIAILPTLGGASEYVRHGVNGFLLDPFYEDQCVEKLIQIADAPEELSAMKAEAIATASGYSARQAAAVELALFRKERLKLQTKPLLAPRVQEPRTHLIPARVGFSHKIAGSGYVRLLLPYTTSLKAGKDITPDVISSFDLPAPIAGHTYVLQRDLWHIEFGELKSWLQRLKAAGAALVYDLDDDLLDSRALVSRGYRVKSPATEAKVLLCLEAADVVTVATEALAESLSYFNDNIVVVENYISEEQWGHFADADGEQKCDGKADAPATVIIGYAGTPSHYSDLLLIAESMRDVEAQFGTSIRLEIVGGFEGREALFGNIIPLPRDRSYPNFVQWLKKTAKWDIALIPLADDRFNQHKSRLKFLEMAALGTAIVCSDVPSYQGVAVHAHNALCVDNTRHAWTEAVAGLIKDSAMRKCLKENARSDLESKWLLENNLAFYNTVLSGNVVK